MNDPIRRIVLGAALVLLSAAPERLCAAAAPVREAPLDAAMKRLMADARTSHALYALDIVDADSGRTLYAHASDTFATAASTTKLVTEGITLTLLGPDFRWTTPVYRDGPVDAGGTLHGNLILVASGDPNLSGRIQPDGSLAFENEDHAYDGDPDTRAVPGDPLLVMRELAKQVQRSGITHVTGRVLVDHALFADSTESGTGVTLSPAVVNDNLVDVLVTAGADAGAPTAISVSPKTPYVTFVNDALTGAPGDEASIDMSADAVDAAGNHAVTISGVAPAGTSVLYAYRVTDPAAFAAAAFARALADRGVGSNGHGSTTMTAAYDDANLVAKHVSPPLSEDVYVTLKVSQNLHAALMPYMWGAYAVHARENLLRSGFLAGGDALQRGGIDLDGAVAQDGEGGSAFFTPAWMARYLVWARREPWFPQFLRGLPVLGVDGTLAKIQLASPARGAVFAKTGTDGWTNRLRKTQLISKGLAGYMTTSHGKHVAFAFYVDRVEGPASENTGQVAGEILGSLATATYVNL